jgi:hypothetical protein
MLLMVTDRTMKDGTISKCLLDDDVRVDLKAAADKIGTANAALESLMRVELRQIPIYTEFLSKVYGCGPVVAAYLCAMVRIDRATKPSNLRRYCGYALDKTGHLERRDGGPKYAPDGSLTGAAGTFNDDLRRSIWLMLTAMRKNAAKVLADAPFGVKTKYLEIWDNSKHRSASMGITRGAHKKGLHKAADIFIEDLYTIWRTLAGFEVWPNYYAAKLGYEHGGKISVNAPRMLTPPEALALVGDVGKVARTSPAPVFAKAKEEAEEEIAAE